MPLALTFAFKLEMGVKGLWLGFSIACILLDLGFWAIISCPSWHKIANKMKAKIHSDNQNQTEILAGYRDGTRTPESQMFRRKVE